MNHATLNRKIKAYAHLPAMGGEWVEFDAGEPVIPFGEVADGHQYVMTIAGAIRVSASALSPYSSRVAAEAREG